MRRIVCTERSARDLRFDTTSAGWGLLEDYYVHVQGVPPILAWARGALLKPE